MNVDKKYLTYPHRSYGMDHSLYEWSILDERAPIVWPNGKKLALWVNINLQFFRIQKIQLRYQHETTATIVLQYPTQA